MATVGFLFTAIGTVVGVYGLNAVLRPPAAPARQVTLDDRPKPPPVFALNQHFPSPPTSCAAAARANPNPNREPALQ